MPRLTSATAIVSALNGRFESQVDVRSLQVAVFPRPEVSGAGLVLRHNGRTDVAPLITVRSFAGRAGIAGLFATPLSLSSIELEGADDPCAARRRARARAPGAGLPDGAPARCRAPGDIALARAVAGHRPDRRQAGARGDRLRVTHGSRRGGSTSTIS